MVTVQRNEDTDGSLLSVGTHPRTAVRISRVSRSEGGS
jgi:hypothetical protein